jgi:hypothetical protein
MDKTEELLKALGLEIPADDADIKAIVAEYREKLTEEVKGTIDISDKLAQAKEEGGIVAEKRIKKAINTRFQLGLTNMQSDSTPVEKIMELGAEKIKGSASEDVEKLNARLIEQTNELNRKDEEKDLAVKAIEAEWKGKWKSEKVTQALLQTLSPVELTIDKNKALKLLQFEAAEQGLSFDVDDNGVLIKKGETKAMKPDNTGHETLETFTDRTLDEFKKKSNGSGGQAVIEGKSNAPELSPEAMSRINEMKAKMGSVAA